MLDKNTDHMKTFGFHVLILHAFLDVLIVWLDNHIADMDVSTFYVLI